MAFVFRSDRGDVLTQKNPIPGPGSYIGPTEYRPPKSVAPFNSTAKRERDEKAEEQLPGPGSYNISIDLKNQGQNAKILVSSLNPEPIEVEKPKLSNVFKSTSKRFEEKQIKEELPGPGAYYKEKGFVKQYQNPNAGLGSSRYQMIERAIKNTKFLSIPSIPSNVHSYGYSETENHDLLLNKNPLLEVQQFVGPGYYEVKDSFNTVGQKGVNWGKSGAKRFAQTTGAKVPTGMAVGPGSYETASKGTPLYKLKPSAGFASQSRRGFEERTKENSKAKRSSASAVESRLSGAIGFDEEEEDEYIEDATPGPGYYYNPSATSSIKVQYKPAKLQFFGSGTERFKELNQNANYLGPGEYSMPGILGKKKPNYNAPFQTSNVRFEKEKLAAQPGPGAYNPKVNLVDQLVDKKKKGYVGHFGTTDKRFKQQQQPLINTPGPGAYYQENDKDKVEDLTESANKGSHFFKSSTKRENNTKKDEGPPPGAYDLKYYDLATKVIKEEEDPELSPKKAPFNSTDPRFREVKAPIIDEDDLPKPSGKVNDVKKVKPSAPFASSVKRADEVKGKDFIPGPGAYHDANDNSNWNKRTFNIHFTVD